jgi:hypothetical protein
VTLVTGLDRAYVAGTGVHAPRLLGVAVVDVLVTLAAAVGCLIWLARELVSAELAAAHAEADIAIAAREEADALKARLDALEAGKKKG